MGNLKKRSFHRIVFFFLLLLVFILGSLNLAKAKGMLLPEQPAITVVDGTIDLDSLTLDQKIAQMIIVPGYAHQVQAWKNLQLGGIHLFALQEESLFKNTIEDYQQDMSIPFFVTVDLEGCLNPFAAFHNFTYASAISTPKQAYEKGVQEGQYLREVGITLNFAPVVDLDDVIWKCRSFPGNEQEVTLLAEQYIRGLQQQGVLATAKHYPGKTLVVRDPHKYLVAAEINAHDVYPYTALSSEVASIMVSHIITSGTIDSHGLPAVASSEVIGELKKNFTGLIISDEINMLGLRNYYATLDEMYVAVFKAGNDVVLNFNDDPQEIYRLIQIVKGAVERGEISQEQIDASVRKILVAKGLKVE